MKGLYKIYQNKDLVISENVITVAGKEAGLNALAGLRLGFVSSIGIGIGDTVASTSDSQLNFLVSGGDVDVAIPDTVNGKIYFKTTLPVDDEYVIHELACLGAKFAGVQNISQTGLLMASFNSDQNWTDVEGVHSADSVNNRIGSEAFSYAIDASGTAKGQLQFERDLSGFTMTSLFKFAYYTNNIASVAVRLKTDDSNYFEATSLTVTSGYHIDSVQKSAFTTVGAPDWSTITVFEIEIDATASAGTFSLDGLRIDVPAGIDNSILSRTVLGTPLKKLAGVQMDVEYVLEPEI